MALLVQRRLRVAGVWRRPLLSEVSRNQLRAFRYPGVRMRHSHREQHSGAVQTVTPVQVTRKLRQVLQPLLRSFQRRPQSRKDLRFQQVQTPDDILFHIRL